MSSQPQQTEQTPHGSPNGLNIPTRTHPLVIFLGPGSADIEALFQDDPTIPFSFDSAAIDDAETPVKLGGERTIYIWPEEAEEGEELGTELLKLPYVPWVKLVGGPSTATEIIQQGEAAFTAYLGAHSTAWTRPKAEARTRANERKLLSQSIIAAQGFDEARSLGLDCNEQGTPYITLDNVMRLLNNDKRFKDAIWFDEFHNRVYTTINCVAGEARQWDMEFDCNRLLLTIQRDLRFRKFSKALIQDAVGLFAQENTRNEPMDWMDKLTWDRKDRLTGFFNDYYGVTDANSPKVYTEAISRNFWLSMVARIFKPGCIAKNMVVLEGAQNALKSTSLAIIGGKWYLDCSTRIDDEVRFAANIQGKMLIEISELDSFRKSDTTTMKACLSRRTDRARLAYRHDDVDYPRHCIFAGTTNSNEYLKDDENVRFWPIPVRKVDIAALERDREQLFAQAVSEYKDGRTWWEVPLNESRDMQFDRRFQDTWEIPIVEWLENQTQTTIEAVAGSDTLGLSITRIDSGIERRIARCLKVAGWKPARIRVNGRLVRGWVAPGTNPTA